MHATVEIAAAARQLKEADEKRTGHKTEADRLAFEAIFDSGRPLRIVDILGREFMVAPVGPIGKQIQRSMPNNTMSTGLRDFHRYRLSLVEVSS